MTAGVRRIDDLRKSVNRVVGEAIDQKVDAFIFTGDLADPDCGSMLVHVLELAHSAAGALRRAGILNVWVPGNHCVLYDGSGKSVLSALRTWDVLTQVFEQPATFTLKGVFFALLPYTAVKYDPDAWLRSVLAVGTLGTSRAMPRAVLGHCTGMRGVEVGSESRDMSRGADLVFPEAACAELGVDYMGCGHFHKRQVTAGGIHIPGTLERLRFDEEGNSPGFYIVEIGECPKEEKQQPPPRTGSRSTRSPSPRARSSP